MTVFLIVKLQLQQNFYIDSLVPDYTCKTGLLLLTIVVIMSDHKFLAVPPQLFNLAGAPQSMVIRTSDFIAAAARLRAE